MCLFNKVKRREKSLGEVITAIRDAIRVEEDDAELLLDELSLVC